MLSDSISIVKYNMLSDCYIGCYQYLLYACYMCSYAGTPSDESMEPRDLRRARPPATATTAKAVDRPGSEEWDPASGIQTSNDGGGPGVDKCTYA